MDTARRRANVSASSGEAMNPIIQGWLAAVIKDLSIEDSVRVMVTLWTLWHARQKKIHEGQYQSHLLMHCFVEHFINELNHLDHVPTSTPVRSFTGTRWIVSSEGLAKVNVHAALSKNSSKKAIAAVAWSLGCMFSRCFGACFDQSNGS
jgi:hypothetical protein